MTLRDLLPSLTGEHYCIMGRRDVYTGKTDMPKSEIVKLLDLEVDRIFAQIDLNVPVYGAKVCVVLDDRSLYDK